MGMTANATVVAIASLLLFSVPLLLRVVSLTTATHYLCAVGALTFVSLAALGGGIRSPAIAGFTLIPLAVVFTLGPRAAIVWTVIAAAFVVGLYVGTDVLGVVPEFREPEGYGRLIVGTHVAVIGMILWFAWRFWQINQRVVDRQETTIERTREMARHLEGATRELSDAAARFVRGGLLAQLADKANSGRESISSARRRARAASSAGPQSNVHISPRPQLVHVAVPRLLEHVRIGAGVLGGHVDGDDSHRHDLARHLDAVLLEGVPGLFQMGLELGIGQVVHFLDLCDGGVDVVLAGEDDLLVDHGDDFVEGSARAGKSWHRGDRQRNGQRKRTAYVHRSLRPSGPRHRCLLSMVLEQAVARAATAIAQNRSACVDVRAGTTRAVHRVVRHL